MFRKFSSLIVTVALLAEFAGVMLLLPTPAYAITCDFGVDAGGFCEGIITSGTSWTVPDDWDDDSGSIEAIGGGSGGFNGTDGDASNGNFGGHGGGGGAYVSNGNLGLTPGSIIEIQIGQGGAPSGSAGTPTQFNRTAGSLADCTGTYSLCAYFGNGTIGGSTANSVGSSKRSGGGGGSRGIYNSGDDGGSGGGGGGGGGGQSAGGTIGTNGAVSTASDGGNGGGGGAGGITSGGSGGSQGTGSAQNGAGGTDGGVGGNGNVWTTGATAGAGGGGGGGGANGRDATGEAGDAGNGGNYGAGGGGGGGGGRGNATANDAGEGGTGANGVIVISYTPIAGSSSATLSKPSNNLGLLGYWSLDDNAGTKATDFSGNRNTGTFSSSPVWVNGKRGAAVNFDASGSYINAGSSNNFNFTTGAFSVSFWEKSSSLVDSTPFVGRRNSPNGWSIQTGGNFAEFCFSSCVDGTRALDDGVWHLVTVTRSGTTATFYIDGALDVSRTVSDGNSNAGTNLLFGANQALDQFLSDATTAVVDDIRIYNRELGASEVSGLYRNGATRLISSSKSLTTGSALGASGGLVGHWSFDGASFSNVVTDDSGNGNTGYLINTATSTMRTNGTLGQAFSSGAGGYIKVGLGSSINNLTQKTIAMWIYPRSFGAGDGAMLFGSHNIGVDNYYYLSLCTNNADGECPAANNTLTWTQKTTGTSGGWNAPDGSIQLNRWQHVAVTYDCSSIANEPIFYVNGVAVTPNLVVSTPTGATQCNDSSFNKYISAEGLFPGIMDDVRLYSRILTATEIKQLSRLGGATIMP